MKRSLIFCLSIVISAFVFAQSNLNKCSMKLCSNQKKSNVSFLNENNATIVANSGKANILPRLKSNGFKSVKFSSSVNVVGLKSAREACLTANQDLNLVMFTHRGGGEYGLTGNDVKCSFFNGDGNNLDSVIVLQNGANGQNVKYCRIPSGVIYNPSGNTTVSNAYAVVSGLNLIGANQADSITGDIECYFGSKKLNGQNGDNLYLDSKVSHMSNFWQGMSIDGNGVAHVLGYSTDTTILYLISNKGTFVDSTKKFQWERKNIGLSTLNAYYVADAWSNDGQTGYIVAIGMDSTNSFKSPLPVIYKTTDAGQNWTLKKPVNFNNMPELTKYLRSTAPDENGNTTKRAFFTDEFKPIVDAKGDLHILSVVYSASSNKADSLNYYWAMNGVVFDLSTSDSIWKVRMIDTLSSRVVDAAKDHNALGAGTANAVGWDHRIMAAKTSDGNKVFCFWTDTDPDNLSGEMNNINPDLYGWALDINTGNTIPAYNITSSSYYSQLMYFTYVSDIILKDGNTYNIPVTFTTIQSDPTSPIYHYYLNGVQMKETDFTNSIKEVKNNDFSLTGNYPNPVRNTTSFTLNLAKSANVSVSVFNAIGQKVMGIEEGRKASGAHTISLDCRNLKSGLYFYTVKAGEKSITQKMIVE